MNQKSFIAPTSSSERYASLDILRGFAILGILIMNIQSFAMIEAAYINPTAFSDFSGANKWVWILSHLFADQKFMTIFSVLFGAGILLFSERIENKGLKAGSLHYRRTFWLLLIGLAHAYFIWYGDILSAYAVCALFIFLMRRLSVKTQLIIGFLFLAIPSLINIFAGLTIPFWPEQSLNEIKDVWQPGSERIAYELGIYQGSWLQQLEMRIPTAIRFQTQFFLFFIGWRVAGLMLIGMALFKSNILIAKRDISFYVKGLIIGFLVGLSLIIFGLRTNFENNFEVTWSMFLGSLFNYWGSLAVAFGYICLIMLISKKAAESLKLLAGVGRTALSNYLLQSVLATLIFYGHGLGYYGQVERVIQILIVAAIWIIQVTLTYFWLKHFRFGPVEWIWRSLTYWKLQPIKN